MEGEVSIEQDGVVYTAYYEEFDDEVLVELPDGSQLRRVLNRDEPAQSLVKNHLRGYLRQLKR